MSIVRKKFHQFEAPFHQFAPHPRMLKSQTGKMNFNFISLRFYNCLIIRAGLHSDTEIPIVDRYKNYIDIKERRKTFTKSYQFDQFDQVDVYREG